METKNPICRNCLKCTQVELQKKVMKEICLRQKSEDMSLLPGEKRL